MDRAAAQRVTLIPVFLRPCNADRVSFGAQRLPLTTFQSVHSPDRPLSGLPQPQVEAVFVALLDHLHDLASVRSSSPAPSATPARPRAAGTDARLIVQLQREGAALVVRHLLPGGIALGSLSHSPPLLAALDPLTDLLDVATPDGLRAQWPAFEAKWGRLLFDALFGTEADWRPLLRTAFRTPHEVDPSPVARNLHLRVCTHDPHLAALPWRLLRWSERRLVADGWVVHVAADAEQSVDHVNRVATRLTAGLGTTPDTVAPGEGRPRG